MRSVGRCTAFRSCRRRAKYDSPAQLCSKHWQMWWAYGTESRGNLPYMQRIEGKLAALRQPSEFEYACQLLTDLRSEADE